MIVAGILLCFAVGCIFILITYLCVQGVIIAIKDFAILFVVIVFWLISSSICFGVILIILEQLTYLRGV